MEVRTLTTDHWYSRSGTRFPKVPPANGAVDIFYPMRNIVTSNTTVYPNPPRPIVGFVPDVNDSNILFAKLNDANSPYNINSMFLCCVGTPVNDAAFKVQGIEIACYSHYITGVMSKPTVDIPSSTQMTNNYVENIRNNQVSMNIVLETCRTNEQGDTNWNDIFDLNTTPTLEYNNLVQANNTILLDPILNSRSYSNPADTNVVTGVDRFSSPICTIRVDQRHMFKVLKSKMFDFDKNNTLFPFEIYTKLEVKPYASAKYKEKIITVFKTNTVTGTLDQCVANAIHLVFLTHGLYKNGFVYEGSSSTTAQLTAINKMGYTAAINNNNQNTASYFEICKRAINIAFTGKFNFRDR